jgi:ArsR family transcriptional regulator, virulence genes transcriptional regulator
MRLLPRTCVRTVTLAAARNRAKDKDADMAAAQPDPDAMREHADEAVRLLKALANQKRLMILCALVECERSVSEINQLVELSQSALSQHLALLREQGLVETRREAQTIYYRLAPGPVHALIGTLHSIYCAHDS